MAITLYRSGIITPENFIRNRSSEKFDEVTRRLGYGESGRSNSVYFSPSLDEVVDVWFEYRWGRSVNACIYEVALPEGFEPMAYPVHSFEAFARYGNEDFVVDYMEQAKPVTSLEFEELKDYEVLLPYEVALQSTWTIIHCDESLCSHIEGVEEDYEYLGVELLQFSEAEENNEVVAWSLAFG